MVPAQASGGHVPQESSLQRAHCRLLGGLGVSADRAFSTGFLFFVVTIALAVPGVAIILREGVRRR